MGYICNSMDEMTDNVSSEPVTVNDKTIAPGDMTTLNGHFCRPLKYIGKQGSEIIFLIGSDGDLFTKRVYFQSVALIANDRIFEMYSPGAGRDFLFINGKWK